MQNRQVEKDLLELEKKAVTVVKSRIVLWCAGLWGNCCPKPSLKLRRLSKDFYNVYLSNQWQYFRSISTLFTTATAAIHPVLSTAAQDRGVRIKITLFWEGHCNSFQKIRHKYYLCRELHDCRTERFTN